VKLVLSLDAPEQGLELLIGRAVGVVVGVDGLLKVAIQEDRGGGGDVEEALAGGRLEVQPLLLVLHRQDDGDGQGDDREGRRADLQRERLARLRRKCRALCRICRLGHVAT
jgi:hypothetical protein